MSLLSQLKPTHVWIFFEEICNIPRLSKNEGQIRAYLRRFAEKHRLEAKEDRAGNILIIRPASPGMENRKCVVLQSHMDMVGEKNAEHPHDWDNDPIVPRIQGDWVSATGTTLGADDGIGIASQLALLSDNDIRTGRIECLFTVDEESGMTGATGLEPDFFTGRTLLNLDSEDEGILFIGCAGGMDTTGTMKASLVPVKEGHAAIEISVTGLHGGHSGDEIHKGYGNSVKIINSILMGVAEKHIFSLCAFDGGNLRNAIPREAFATIAADKNEIQPVSELIQSLADTIARDFGDMEPDLKISVARKEVPASSVDEESLVRFMKALACCPHGALAWSKEMEDLVETSTNLASAKIEKDGTISIVTTQRSSVELEKHKAGARVAACLKAAGAEVVHSDGYPGWKPDLTSEILGLTVKSYMKLFGREPLVRAIHAGLECGLIYEKIKGIDMISFGPTIRGAHTPEEKIEIRTTKMFWDLLVDVVTNMPEYGN